MEFLVQAENYSAFSAGTLALPAHSGAAAAGVDFETENASVLGALAAYTAEVPKLQDQAVGLNVHPFAFAYYRNSANRIAQYLTGELSLDEALSRLQQDIDDAIAEHPDIKVLASQTAMYSRVEGMRVMENLAQRFPKIDLVIACNDEMALGAIEALDAAGRLGETKITGFDANNDALKSISEGKMLATGDQRPDAQGYWGVVAAYCYLEGMPVPKDLFLPAPVIDASNVKEHLK